MAAHATVDRFALEDHSRELMHRRLDAFNRWRLSPTFASQDDDAIEAEEYALRGVERRFVETERARVRARAAQAPTDADAFVSWFEALEATGPGQHDALFDWLEQRASLEATTWFLRQEVAGEAGFEDLVALTQIKMPPRVKLEMGRNYWDELGQGHESGMHGPMLSRLASELGIDASRGSHDVVWPSLALANLMVAFATHRRHAYESVGALGVIELTAPGRARKVNEGLRRLGIGGEARRYFALHATLDVKHSAAWTREVIHPLVASDARAARPIAEGALMRLEAGALCFAHYRRELGVDAASCASSPRTAQ